MDEQIIGATQMQPARPRHRLPTMAAGLVLTIGVGAGLVVWQTGGHGNEAARSSQLSAASGGAAGSSAATEQRTDSLAAADLAPGAPSATVYTVYLTGSQAAADSIDATLVDPYAIAVADGSPDEMQATRVLIKQLQLDGSADSLRVIDLRSR
jgi:hypothetical protein